MRGFSGYFPPNQLLYLWDLIIGYDSLEVHVCPRSLDPIYFLTYYIKMEQELLGNTIWTRILRRVVIGPRCVVLTTNTPLCESGWIRVVGRVRIIIRFLMGLIQKSLNLCCYWFSLLLILIKRYCMSKKWWPNLYSNLLYKMGLPLHGHKVKD